MSDKAFKIAFKCIWISTTPSTNIKCTDRFCETCYFLSFNSATTIITKNKIFSIKISTNRCQRNMIKSRNNRLITICLEYMKAHRIVYVFVKWQSFKTDILRLIWLIGIPSTAFISR